MYNTVIVIEDFLLCVDIGTYVKHGSVTVIKNKGVKKQYNLKDG